MPICLQKELILSTINFLADLANGEPATEANTDLYKK